MAMPQRDDPPSRCALRRTGTIEAIKRMEPPSPRLRPTLKLRHDKSAGQVRCLNTPLCMGTTPRPRAKLQCLVERV